LKANKKYTDIFESPTKFQGWYFTNSSRKHGIFLRLMSVAFGTLASGVVVGKWQLSS